MFNAAESAGLSSQNDARTVGVNAGEASSDPTRFPRLRETSSGGKPDTCASGTKGIARSVVDDAEQEWAVGSIDGSGQTKSAPAARQSCANDSSASSESAQSRPRVITRLTPSSR